MTSEIYSQNLIMPSESLSNSESNGKRKKNKVPKRLRRKIKENNHINTEDNSTNNIISTTDTTSLTKENIPSLSNISPSNTDDNNQRDTSIHYWKDCTKKALAILEKQSSNRRKLLTERHRERIDSIQYVLYQRKQIELLTEKNHLMSQSLHSVRDELRKKTEELKIFEDKLDDHNEVIRDNDFLRVQLKLVEQKFERFTSEYNKRFEENRQHEQEYIEQIQSLMDEIERIKRDLVLEEYRKQEAERKVRYYDEKIKTEQNLNKKIQQDLIQLKQELKSIHARYDALQIEMLEMHKANNNEISLIPTKDTDDNQWSHKHGTEIDEQMEVKRTKRKTRDRTESSASTSSNVSDKRNKIPKKTSKNKENESNNSSLNVKRKTLRTKKYLPMVTVTQASPSSDQAILVEKDSTQLLLPPSASSTSDTTDSHNTSCESQQPVKPRTKKQSRYPCRRAQRPVKQPESTEQIQQ